LLGLPSSRIYGMSAPREVPTPRSALGRIRLNPERFIVHVQRQFCGTLIGALSGCAVVGAVVMAFVHFGEDASGQSPRSTGTKAPTAGLPATEGAVDAANGVVPLAKDIDNLPLRDPLVVAFPRDWAGPGERPYGVSFDPKKFNGTPITASWDHGILDIQADPERESVRQWFKFATDPAPNWAAFRSASLALRVRFSDEMFRRFRVELTAREQRTTWNIELSDELVNSMRRRGFGDILLPLRDAQTPTALTGLTELALVFDGRQVTTVSGPQTKGELKLHSIRVAIPRGPTLEPRARLDELAARAFEWFEANRNPKTGLVPDRAPNRRYVGIPERPPIFCSIASVGYYLSMLPDAVATGRLAADDARERARTVLQFLEEHAEHHRGLLRHFIDMETGKAIKNDVEFSALDSAILFNGCMVVSVAFGGDVAELADRLIDRADWNALRLPATKDKPELLAMGWKQDTGLLGHMEARSAEFAMPYFIAVGAGAEKRVDPQLLWNTRVQSGTVAGHRVLNPTLALFTSYYCLGWCRLEGRRDRDGVDLWQNAIETALANREFSRAEDNETYRDRWGGWWGISAGDSPRGYIGPGTVKGDAGGTVWPTTALAALPWAEKEIESDLKAWQASPVWDYVDGPFGLAPFNLDQSWVGKDLVGIDLGSFYLAVANRRRETVWNLWRQHPVAKRAMERLYGQK
jgi:hypothetical protein